MADIIIIALVAAAIVGAVCYIYKAKKKGAGCIGCPYRGQCVGKCGDKLDNTGRK